MISIVIVNWNAGSLLEMCVLSLLEHAGETEIVVVDNASEDGSIDFVASLPSSLKVLRNPINLGFAAGNNMGWLRSKGEQVLFLNPDTVCLPGSVNRLAEALRSDPSIWAVGGLLTSPSGEKQAGFNIRSFPTVLSVAAEMLLLDEMWPANRWTRHYRMTDWHHSSAREVDQPAAACLMIQRKALESLGGFDEKFKPAWFEDVDLCKRIRDSGGRIFFEPSAHFLHHGGSSLECLTPREFLEHYHTNQLRYFAKHHGQGTARRVRLLIIAGMYIRAALALMRPITRGNSRAYSAEIFWGTARHFAAMHEVPP